MDPRERLQRIARAWLARRPLYLDTETTGLGRDDEIVEIAILEHDGTPLIDTRLRPRKPIPPEATRVHGIGPLDVQHAPAWPAMQQAVCAALHGRALVIYNANFDLRMLVQTARVSCQPAPAGRERLLRHAAIRRVARRLERLPWQLPLAAARGRGRADGACAAGEPARGER